MYRWADHTGELQLEIEATSEQEVFREAFSAMSELLESELEGSARMRRIDLVSSDRATLLADWLAELAFLAETEGFVPSTLQSLELRGSGLSASVQGRRGEPRHLLKGATYHRLELRPSDGGWRARVILDV